MSWNFSSLRLFLTSLNYQTITPENVKWEKGRKYPALMIHFVFPLPICTTISLSFTCFNFSLKHRAEHYWRTPPLSKSYRITNNKRVFEDFCAEKGFPCIKSFVEFGNEKEITAGELIKFAKECVLVVKPVIRSGGKGILYVESINNDEYLLNGKDAVTIDKLSRMLKEKARTSNYLIQPLLSNHSELRNLTNGWLACVRVITVLDRKNGNAEYLISVFQMPIGKRTTCNV